jgi:hypothetical protein
MEERINPRIKDSSAEEFDPGFPGKKPKTGSTTCFSFKKSLLQNQKENPPNE